MHVDASAMVAILTNEPERNDLVSALASAEDCTTSIVSSFEAVLALRRKTGDGDSAVHLFREFLLRTGIRIADAGDTLLEGLLECHGRYGKGSGHPARLNMGDCFSYAMAGQAGVPLLYKGDDFARTDLA
ncbi:MAG: type II toxin-antitoxin system VapC family toxin [Hyphomicrobiales bacterium]|nr:type II toxin-antitoxin system VapC family toxin [Hyphomicrobiales bacterium]